MILRGVFLTEYETGNGSQFPRFIDADVSGCGFGVEEVSEGEDTRYVVFLWLKFAAAADQRVNLFSVAVDLDSIDGEDIDPETVQDIAEGIRDKAERKAARMAKCLHDMFATLFYLERGRSRVPFIDFAVIDLDVIEAQAIKENQ